MAFDPTSAVLDAPVRRFDPSTALAETSTGSFDPSTAVAEQAQATPSDSATEPVTPQAETQSPPLIDVPHAIKSAARIAMPSVVNLFDPKPLIGKGSVMEEMGKPILNLPRPSGHGVGAGVVRGLESLVEGATTPENIALMGSLAGAPAALAKIASGVFAAQAIKGVPEAFLDAKQAHEAGDSGAAAEHLVGGVGSLAIAGLAGTHSASRIQSPAAELDRQTAHLQAIQDEIAAHVVQPLDLSALPKPSVPNAEQTPAPKELSTETPPWPGISAQEIAKPLGIDYQGESLGLHAFRDPQTGGNFSVKVGELSPERTAEKLNAMRAKFSPPVEIEPAKGEGQTESAGGDSSLSSNPPETPSPTPKIEEPKAEAAARSEGPGAAAATEFPEQGTVGAYNAAVDEQRADRGLEPLMSAAREANPDTWDKAVERIENNPESPEALVEAIHSGEKKSVSREEQAELLWRLTDLRNKLEMQSERAADSNSTPEEQSEAQSKAEGIEALLARTEEADRMAGSAQGAALQFRQVLANEDYSFAGLMRKERKQKGRPLTSDERATIKTQAEEIERLRKVESDSAEVSRQAAENAEIARIAQATVKELEAAEAVRPKYSPLVFEHARKVVEMMEKRAESARGRLRERLGRTSAGVDPTIVLDVAEIMAAKIGRFSLNFAETSTALIAEFGNEIQPYLKKAWVKAQQILDKDLKVEPPKVREAVKTGAINKKGEKTPVDILARAKAEATAEEPLSHKTVYDYVRSLINEKGIHGEDALMKAAHEGLKEAYPNLTEREVRRAYSEYGKVKFPSKEADKIEMAELRQLVRLQESINRETEGLPSLKTGLQRDRATQAIRDKQKTLNELLKKRQGPPSPEKLASRNEAKVTALKNRIEDLDRQLRTGEKPKSGTPAPDSPEVEQLKSERDAMQAKIREIEDTANPPTPEHVRELNRLQDRIDEVKDRLGRMDIEKKPGKSTADTPEIAAAKAELKSLNETIAELRKPTPKPEAEKQMDALAKIRDRLDETLSGKRDPSSFTPFTPLSAAAADLKLEIIAMQELAAQLSRDAKPKADPNAAKEKAQLKALDEAIARYDKKIAASDFSTKGKTHGPDTLAVATLKAIRDARRAVYNAAKKASKPVLSAEERYNATRAKQFAKQLKEVQARIAKGDYAPRAKPVPKKLSAANTAAKFALDKEKQKFNQGLIQYKLSKRSPVRKVLETSRDVLNTARAVMTSFDLSAVLRQGGFVVMGHPIRAAKAFPAMFRALASEKGQFAVNEEIKSRPNAELYAKSKLFLNDPSDMRLSKMEEAYMSRWSQKIPGVAHSERAYTTFLNRLRSDSFDAMARSIGHNLSAEEGEAIANFVNVATGRGNLASASGAATNLNSLFFSPRYVVSRFELLAGQPLYHGTASTRLAIAKEYGRFLAGIGVVYGLSQLTGAEVEKDPRSSDFGKLKFGNTRVDPLSGLSQSTVLLARVTTGKMKTNQGMKAIRGGKLPFGQPDTADITGRFLRTKLSPIIGTAIDLSSGSDVIGNPVTATSAAMRMAVPLSFGDVYTAMKDQGVPAGAAIGILALFGMGVQSYEAKERPVRPPASSRAAR